VHAQPPYRSPCSRRERHHQMSRTARRHVARPASSVSNSAPVNTPTLLVSLGGCSGGPTTNESLRRAKEARTIPEKRARIKEINQTSFECRHVPVGTWRVAIRSIRSSVRVRFEVWGREITVSGFRCGLAKAPPLPGGVVAWV
jgi:hypothetical protein